MKSITLTCIAIIAILSLANAQEYGFNKGSKFVDGSFRYSISNENSIKSTFSQFTISSGYFLTNKFSLGPIVSTAYYRNVIDDVPKVNVIVGGVMSRYYFLNLGERFKTFAGLTMLYRDITVDEIALNNDIESSKTRGFGLDTEIGANYFITPKIALNFTFNNLFSYSFERETEMSSSSTYNLNINEIFNPLASSSFGLTFKF